LLSTEEPDGRATNKWLEHGRIYGAGGNLYKVLVVKVEARMRRMIGDRE
jgi:hypothetical protein